VKIVKTFVRKISATLICLLILSTTLGFTANVKTVIAQYFPPTYSGKITVYPDGKVSLSGTVNQTLTGINPNLRSSVQFSKSSGKIKVESEVSMTMPPEAETQFPFEVIDMSSSSQFLDGFYNSSETMSFKIKEQIASQLNLSDFSANGQCSNGDFSGALTVHLIPGLSVGQVEMNFEGNQSYIHVYGNTTVYYVGGVTPEFVNNTIAYLEANMTGRGPYSLYNMTMGAFECLSLEVDKTPIGNEGAFITFDTEIISLKGTFIDSAVYLLILFLTNEQPGYGTAMLSILLYITFLPASLIVETATSASFQAAYSRSTRQFSMSTNTAMDYDAVIEKITSIIEELMDISEIPSEIRLLLPYLENILRQHYCYVESSIATLHYANSVLDYHGVEYIVGDLNEAVNYAKDELFEWLRLYIPDLNWQLNYLNQTRIDITSFKYGYTIAGNQLTMYFENFMLRPPLDSQTATSFQLKRFFNLTYGMPPPTPFTLTVEGGSNVTHYVTITRPTSVPPPSSSSEKSMTWINPTISSLQDLTFNVNSDPTAKGFTITNPESITQSNPFICNATDLASVLISIKQASCPISIAVKNMSGPPSGGENPPSGFKFLGRYVEIICDPSDATIQATIRFYYTDDQLKAAGVDESSLKVFYWNSTSSRWEEYPSTINTAENYVEINVTHFSVWTLMGQPPSPIWTQPWFIATIAAAIIIIAAVVIIFTVKHRKPKVSETPSLTQPTLPTENP
jgi:hypothetical protein